MIRIFSKNRKQFADAAFIGEIRLTARALTGAVETIARPGWLYCNGAVVSQAKYSKLFSRFGTLYNIGGEGAGNFRLPDYRGRILSCDLSGAAAGGTRMVAAAGVAAGEAAHALTKAETPRHVHDKGTLAVTNGGSHVHSQNFTMGANNNAGGSVQDRVRSGWTSGSVGGATGWFSGSTSADTHTHPSGEFSGATGDGSADTLAGAAHSNVPPVHGCAMMVAFE